MKRNRYNERDAERAGDVPHFDTPEERDAFFRCRHGADLTRHGGCAECRAEAAELRATIEYDLYKEEGGL